MRASVEWRVVLARKGTFPVCTRRRRRLLIFGRLILKTRRYSNTFDLSPLYASLAFQEAMNQQNRPSFFFLSLRISKYMIKRREILKKAARQKRLMITSSQFKHGRNILYNFPIYYFLDQLAQHELTIKFFFLSSFNFSKRRYANE